MDFLALANWWVTLAELALPAIPLMLALAAVSAALAPAKRVRGLPQQVSRVALGLAVLVAVGAAASPLKLRLVNAFSLNLRLDLVTAVMLMLVCFIGLCIARYAEAYLAGDPQQARHARWMLATLAAATAVIVTNNLFVLVLAWTAMSLSLHQLLTLYQQRPQALIAAHKKFLISRLADVCLAGALLWLSASVGSLEFHDLEAYAQTSSALPVQVHMACLLLAIATCLRCAQLPFHGWLIQVMEAPTPVSALLHAGVVNIGGFLMIRLGALMSHATAAQTLLIVVGCASAALGALVTTTRGSIKVALAWSTCAQMGFMLVQCGLGAYHMALLHLLAHSLYKAHAFLGSGSTVESWRARTLVQPARALTAASLGLAGLAGVGLVALTAMAVGVSLSHQPVTWVMFTVLGFALAPLVVRAVQRGQRAFAKLLLSAIVISLIYFQLHKLFAHVVTEVTAPALWQVALVVTSFCGLFVVQLLLLDRRFGSLGQRIYPYVNAGFFLDELFTRMTFRLWPAKLPARNVNLETTRIVDPLGV